MTKDLHQPSDICLQRPSPSLGDIDFSVEPIQDKSLYIKQLKHWQTSLLDVQSAYFRQKKRAIIVFEGWDASGKGGVIRRITEKLDSRGFRVHPIAAPSIEEQGCHYLYRFQTRLPKPGTLAIFDRSYYGRVLVERIEKLASPHEWQRAYQEINEFERLLIDDDVRITKFFLHITPEEQLKRFQARLSNPIKQWKITQEDIRNRQKWGEYELAIEDMLQQTSTQAAPWHVIPANNKWNLRVTILKQLCEALSHNIDLSPPPLDTELIHAAQKHLGLNL